MKTTVVESGPVAPSPRRCLAGLMRALVGSIGIGLMPAALADGPTCDPTIATCIPADCTPTQIALGLCQPPGGGGGGGGGGMCTPPPGGNPTCGSGPAGLGAGGPSAGGGNPINLLNGNKYQEETDLPALPGVLGLELKRHYNSQSSHPGLLGAHWRMSYETVLYDVGNQIQIVQADGRRLVFQRGVGANATLCSSSQPQDGQVRVEAATDGRGQPTYFWRWADGRTLMFTGGSGGGYPLHSITAASGERLTLSYSPAGELTTIRDPQGRTLSFVYAAAAEKRSRALKAIDTPLGRLTYRQDAIGRLTEVGQARDATSAPYLTRLYHHEERHHHAGLKAALLTGISVRSVDPKTQQPVEQRVSTYAYNAAGQAVLSTKGRPRESKDGQPLPDTGIDQVDVEYVEKALPIEGKADRASGEVVPRQLGRSVLTNSLGHKTQVTSAVIGGHFRLIEMRGSGCSSCGPSNMRYAYDAQGRLVRATRLDDTGRAAQSEITQLDRYGRVIRTGVQLHDSSQSAKAQPVRWLQRFEYPDVRFRDGSIAVAPQPSLIARPSVVAGKERTLRVEYNQVGQTTKMVEEGWNPIDDKGQLTALGVAMQRSTSYRYQQVNGRSLLVEIDGPLPNAPDAGPGNSDITRFEWDREGRRVVRYVKPGGVVVGVEVDDLGRTVATAVQDGSLVSRFEFRYGEDSTVSHFRRTGRMLDEQGRVVATSDRSTEWTAPPEQAPPGGAPAGAPPGPQRFRLGSSVVDASDNSFDLDEYLRPVLLRDSHRQPLLQMHWGPIGSMAQSLLLGIEAGDSHAERWVDDWGRPVAIRLPGQGVQYVVRDAAGRIVHIVDARGARQEIAYDTRQRAVSVMRYMPGSMTASESLRFAYAGGALVSEEVRDVHGIRRIDTVRDSLGREITSINTSLKHGESNAIRFELHHELDKQGRRQSTLLTDATGQRLRLGINLDENGVVRARYAQVELHPLAEATWRRLAMRLVGGDRLALESLAPTPQTPRRSEPSQDDQSPVVPETTLSAARTAKALVNASNQRSILKGPGEHVDQAGLPAQVRTTEGLLELAWTVGGQLASSEQVRPAGQRSRTSHAYDARGRRVMRTVAEGAGTGVRYFLYEGMQLLAEMDEQGRLLYVYAHRGFRPIAQLSYVASSSAPERNWRQQVRDWIIGARPPTVAYFDTGRTGRVLALRDARGNALWNASELNALQVHQPLREVGQYADSETGLRYHGMRFFVPDGSTRIGRFLSPDPRGIADAVFEVEQDFMLDTYAYVGGRVDDFFDPDGAAKIRYFMIDSTGGQGNHIKGRWAFYVYDIGGIAGQTRFLYDANGTFIGSNADPTFSRGNTLSWVVADESLYGGSPVDGFVKHYQHDLVSPDRFVVSISDEHARHLIADINAHNGNVYRKYWCAGGNPTLMYPAVSYHGATLTPGGIDNPNDGAGGSLVQQCTNGATVTQMLTPRRRFELLDAATRLQESGSKCALPCPGQIVNGTGWRGGNVYPNASGGWPASWGPTQFTTATFLAEVIRVAEDPSLDRLNAGITPFQNSPIPASVRDSLVPVLSDPRLTAAERLTALGIDAQPGQPSTLLQAYKTAYAQAENVRACWDQIGSIFGFRSNDVPARTTFLEYYEPAPAIAACTNFNQRTALGPADFEQMITWWRYRRASVPVPGETLSQVTARNEARTTYLEVLQLADMKLNGSTNNETLNAWHTKSIMSNVNVQQALLAVFNSTQNFDALSDQVLWREMTYMPLLWPDRSEREIAGSFAYFHNAGTRRTSPISPYVTGFQKHWDTLAAKRQAAEIPCFSLDARRIP